MNVRLYLAQRISALVMVPLVFGHLLVMILAVRNGLTANEILERTQGSIGWALFYGIFVVAVAVHASIGLRSIIAEWAGWRGAGLNVLVAVIGFVLLALGLRAVYAVVT